MVMLLQLAMILVCLFYGASKSGMALARFGQACAAIAAAATFGRAATRHATGHRYKWRRWMLTKQLLWFNNLVCHALY